MKFSENMFKENGISLNISSSLAIFGLFINTKSQTGAYNCFYPPSRSHIAADALSCGYAELNGYSPNNPSLFSIALNQSGYPVIDRFPEHSCGRLGNDDGAGEFDKTMSSASDEELNTNALFFENEPDISVLRSAIGSSLHRNACLVRLSSLAVGPGKSALRGLLDSLSEVWSGTDRALALRARLPFLFSGSHWSEARRTLNEIVASKCFPVSETELYDLFIQASDSATRGAFMETYHASRNRMKEYSSEKALACSAYYHASVSNSVPYPIGKLPGSNREAASDAQRIRMYPNPSSTDVTCVEAPLDGSSHGILSVWNMIGQCVRQLEVEGDGNQRTAVIHLGALPVGIYLVRWTTGTVTASDVLHVVRNP